MTDHDYQKEADFNSTLYSCHHKYYCCKTMLLCCKQLPYPQLEYLQLLQKKSI